MPSAARELLFETACVSCSPGRLDNRETLKRHKGLPYESSEQLETPGWDAEVNVVSTSTRRALIKTAGGKARLVGRQCSPIRHIIRRCIILYTATYAYPVGRCMVCREGFEKYVALLLTSQSASPQVAPQTCLTATRTWVRARRARLPRRLPCD